MRSQTKKKVTSWLLLPQNINCYHCNKFIFVNWKSQKNLIELLIGGFPFNTERAFHSQWNLDETEEHHILCYLFVTCAVGYHWQVWPTCAVHRGKRATVELSSIQSSYSRNSDDRRVWTGTNHSLLSRENKHKQSPTNKQTTTNQTVGFCSPTDLELKPVVRYLLFRELKNFLHTTPANKWSRKCCICATWGFPNTRQSAQKWIHTTILAHGVQSSWVNLL